MNNAVKINHYIVISIAVHLLLILFFGATYSTTAPAPSIFNVNIVDVPNNDMPPAPEAAPPPARQQPVPGRMHRRPPEKHAVPETLYGEGSEADPKSTAPERSGGTSPETGAQTDKGTSLQEGPSGTRIVPPSSLFDRQTIEEFASRNAPKDRGLTFDISEFKNRGYMRMLRDRIESIWEYPREAARQGISGDLFIKFIIKKDGTLGDVELLRTSGYSVLDEAAIKALKHGEPYWPLPSDWDKDVLEIKGHFIYVYGASYLM